MTGRICFGVLERQHQAGGVLAGAAEGRVDADALQPFDDRFVDAQRSYSRSLPSDATSFHGLKPLLTP